MFRNQKFAKEIQCQQINKNEVYPFNSYIFFLFNGKMKVPPKQQIGKIQTSIIFIIRLGFVLHLYLTLLPSILNNNFTPFLQTTLLTIQNNIIYKFFQIALIIFKLLISKLAIDYVVFDNAKDSLFQKTHIAIVKHISLIAQFDLVISGLFLLVNFWINAGNFVLSGLFTLFVGVYFENYVDRRDYLYSPSPTSSITFKLVLILSYILNSTLLQWQSLSTFMIAQLFLICFILIWVFTMGKRLYFNQFTIKLQIILTTLIILPSLIIIQVLVINQKITLQEAVGEFIVILTTLLIFFVVSNDQSQNYLKRHLENDNQINAKMSDLLLNSLFQKSHSSRQANALFLGTLNYSQNKLEQFTKSYNNSFNLYDPILMKQVQLKEEGRQTESSLRFYIKSYFQNILKTSINDKQILMNFSQFLFSNFRNPHQIIIYFSKLKLLNISIIDKLKIQTITFTLRKQSQIFNKQLYQGILCLEQVIQAESNFQQICQNIQEYGFNSVQIWKQIRKDEIKLSELQQKMHLNFSLKNSMTKKWNSLLKHFPINNKFKFVHTIFQCFIQNQKIKLKDMINQSFALSQQKIFTKQHLFYTNQLDLNKFDNRLLYNNDTLYINAIVINNQLTINKVSRNYKQKLHYSKEQLIGNAVKILLTADIKQIHDQKVIQWLKKGYLINQQFYIYRRTTCLTKYDKQVPVVKYYKMFINQSGDIELVALIHINEIPKQIKSTKVIKFDLNNAGLDNYNLDQDIKNQHQLKQKTNKKQNSFEHEHNIFIKQENLHPVPNYPVIAKLKLIIRVFILIIGAILIIQIFVTQTDTTNCMNYATQYINFMSYYRYPMSIGANYIRYFLGMGGNKTKLMYQIQSASSYMKAIMTSKTMLKSIFNENLNPSRMYFPYRNDSVNKGIGFNQVDLFFTVSSNIMSMAFMPINRTGYQFRQFNSYLPSYNNWLNATKFQFHTSFSDIFQSMKLKQAEIIIGQTGLFMLVMILVIVQVITFQMRMKQIMKILVDLSHEDINKSLQYWRGLIIYFTKLNLKYKSYLDNTIQQQQQSSKQLGDFNSFIDQQNQQKVSMNKKTKIIIQTKQQAYSRRKQIVLTVIILTLIFGSNIIIETIIYYKVNDLINFENQGFFFLQYYPVTAFIAYGALQKFYSQAVPGQLMFYSEKYNLSLNEMQRFGHSDYIGDIKDKQSLYLQKQKNYFFGNLCTFNPVPLYNIGLNVTVCQMVSNQSFKKGMSTFIRFGNKVAYQYFQNKRKLAPAQIQEFIASCSIVGAYVIDALLTWTEEFKQRIQIIITNNISINIGIILFTFLIYFIAFEMYLFKIMEKHYEHISIIYLNYIPQEVLLKQKIITQKYIQLNLLKQF